MGPDKQGLPARVGDGTDVFARDCDKAFPAEPFKLGFIVHDCSKGIKLASRIPVKILFRLSDRTDHPSAEAGMLLDLYSGENALRISCHCLRIPENYSSIPNLPWHRPWNQTISSWRVMSELSRTNASAARVNGEVSRCESM